MRLRSALLALALALGAAAQGCNSESAGVNPAPLRPGQHAPARRKILLRNPFGGPADNLLVDGDFELSVEPQGNDSLLGWVGYDENSNLFSVRAETGGICRTGLRCAVLEPKSSYWAAGTAAAEGKAHSASVWVKIPEDASCSDVRPVLVTCDSGKTRTKLAAGEPDIYGWCDYSAKLDPQSDALCLYIESDLVEPGLVDSAMILPDEAGTSAKPAEYWAPPPETAARIEAMSEAIRQRARMGGSKRHIRTARPIE